MKLRQMSPFSKRFIRKKKRGFALIATLTLMMLLTLLAVGILALASSQNRISLQTILQAEARQQALVGLDAALGELQVELGPDRRVSANSGILEKESGRGSQYLLGVWDSWDGPIYGRSVQGKGGSIRETYDKGRSSMIRRGLISSRNAEVTRRMDAAEKLTGRRPGERICLVGEGTLGTEFTARHYVYADLLSMPSVGNNTACFAWWVGAENQKAKITVTDPEESSETIDVLHRTWNTPGPMFVNSENLSFLPEKIEQPDKIVTLGSLPLATSASQSPGTPYFFDVTTTSYSLPVNVRMGGLKQDLNLLLNKKSLRGTEFAARNNQDCPIVEGEDVPQGTENNMPIGSWQNLHAYYQCWPDGSASDGDNFTARLIGNVDKAHTRMSGSVTMDTGGMVDDPDRASVNSSSASFYDTRAMIEEGSRSAGYARTPVMLAFMSNFALWTEQNVVNGTPLVTSDESKNPVYDLCLTYAPTVLWWNPYNVPMRIRGQQLWSHSAPYRVAWIQNYCVSSHAATLSEWKKDWMRRGLVRRQPKHQMPGLSALDFGDYFQKSLSEETADIVFAPGEILFFSPGKSRTVLDKGDQSNTVSADPQEAPWILGYHPSNVSGYKAKIYSNDTAYSKEEHGTPTKHNVDAGRFPLQMRLGLRGGDGTNDPWDDPGAWKMPVNEGDPNWNWNATDGWWLSRAPGAITLLNGYNGIGASDVNGERNNPGDPTRGKRASSPQNMQLGWYDWETSDVKTEISGKVYWSTDGSQMDANQPYYVCSLGVVPKSANMTMDSRLMPNKDFRTKLWQHSSPAFWGSAIASPDDQQRQYHPYQLAVLDVGAGLSSSPMDCIGNNGVLGINSEGEQVSFASVLELPVHPPFSLAGFAGMRLQPGWYTAGGRSDYKSDMRRMQYQAGVPGVGIGNSFADPCIPADDVYKLHTTKHSDDVSYNKRIFGDYYDHGLLVNDALWDRWFCSSVSDMPQRAGGKKEAREVLEDFLSGKSELPVARYHKTNAPISDSDVVSRIMEGDGWKHIAQYLMVDGGFNVNSTSEEAWTAVLQGLAKRKLVTNVGTRLSLVEENKNKEQVLFSRFMVSTTDKSVDSLGGYSMLQGSSSFRRNSGATSAWGEVRMLEPEHIRELARQMVKQVRERGPFLSMSDFINRRLESGSDNALKGALQAAIDATDINIDFQDVKAARGNQGSLFSYPEAENGSIYTAAPGYLIQSDVLASLGNILTVRDDTFTVRAYGCVKSASNAILAQAWCEAVVQRTMDYVDPSNAPEDADYAPDGSRAEGLSKTNKVLGRRFRVVSFKWLDAWDI